MRSRSDDDMPNCATIEALEDGVVLAIDRQNAHAFLCGGVHHDLAGHDENFFARNRQIFARFDRGQRRTQSAGSDNRNQDHFSTR